MYMIFSAGALLYAPVNNKFYMYEAALSEEIGTTGTFEASFLEAPDVTPLKSIIDIYDDVNLIWRGRVVDIAPALQGVKVTAEGIGGFLNDTTTNTEEGRVRVADRLQKLIDAHNAAALANNEQDKIFAVGPSIVTRVSLDAGGYQSTWEAVSNLAEAAGAAVVIDTTERPATIAIVKTTTSRECNQVIRFGENLLDVSIDYDYTELTTAIKPIGADGITADVMKNTAAIEKYGYIEKVINYDDAETRAELRTAAREDLETLASPVASISVSAIDLHVIDRALDSFKLFDAVHIVSAPHDLDVIMQVQSRTLNLLDASAGGVEFGRLLSTMSATKYTSLNSVQSVAGTSAAGAIDNLTTTTDTSTGKTYRWEIEVTDGAPVIKLIAEETE